MDVDVVRTIREHLDEGRSVCPFAAKRVAAMRATRRTDTAARGAGARWRRGDRCHAYAGDVRGYPRRGLVTPSWLRSARRGRSRTRSSRSHRWSAAAFRAYGSQSGALALLYSRIPSSGYRTT